MGKRMKAKRMYYHKYSQLFFLILLIISVTNHP